MNTRCFFIAIFCLGCSFFSLPAHKATSTAVSRYLLEAVKADDEKKADALISVGANVNFQPECGLFLEKESPLMIASKNANLGIMQKLIDAGAYVSTTAWCSQPRAGYPVLWYAIKRGSLDAVNLLVAAKANINAYTHGSGGMITNRPKSNVRNLSLLSAAINQGVDISIIKALITEKTDINKESFLFGGWTPLMVAAYKGNAKAVQALLDAGADKKIKNVKDGDRLAVDYARENGFRAIVKMLTA